MTLLATVQLFFYTFLTLVVGILVLYGVGFVLDLTLGV